MIGWTEFLSVAKKGTRFEFYPNEDGDFLGDLALQVGEICTVTEDPQQHSDWKQNTWYVSFEDSKGMDWCFYESNHGEKKASFRIISQPDLATDEAVAILKAKLDEAIAAEELEASKEVVQEKIEKHKKFAKMYGMTPAYWHKLPDHLRKLYEIDLQEKSK